MITKEQWGKIISAVLVCLIAILGVFGYDVLVIQPRDAQIAETSAGALSPGFATRSGTGYNTACYLEQGGSQFTCDSGGTIQVNSGATLDVNAGTLQFEGATADGYETGFAVVDPTADRTVTLPNADGTVVLSSLATNAADAANSVTGTSNGLLLEGATANEFETTVTLVDPTADRTITLPNMSGYPLIGPAAGKLVTGVNTITDTLSITHGLTTPEFVLCTLMQDSEANAASCSSTISGSTVTVKVWKADGATAGSVGKLVSWMVGGQP